MQSVVCGSNCIIILFLFLEAFYVFIGDRRDITGNKADLESLIAF